jgi:hypothetical protein
MTINIESLRALAIEAKRRADKATPGPWKLWGMEVMSDPEGLSNIAHATPVAMTFCHNEIGKPRTFDVDFIAAARTDVPALAEAIIALADWCEKLSRVVEVDGDVQDRMAAELVDLTVRAKAAEGEAKALRAALERYGQHEEKCEHQRWWARNLDDSSCPCGLDTIRALPSDYK